MNFCILYIIYLCIDGAKGVFKWAKNFSEKSPISHGYDNWQAKRKERELWLKENNPEFSSHDHQWFIQSELGALMLYVNLKGSASPLEEQQISLLTDLMDEHLVANPPSAQ